MKYISEQKVKMGEISRRYEETNNQNTITKIRKNLAANEMTQKNEQLQIQISNIKASNVVLEHSNRELKEKVKQQQSDQSELFDTLGKLRSKIASLINQNDQLSTEFSTQAKVNSELVENNKNLQIEQSKYEQLQNQFSEQSKEKSELIIRIDQLQKEISELKPIQEQLKQKISNLNIQLVEKNECWQLQHSHVKTKYEQLQNQFTEQTKEKSDLEIRINQYEVCVKQREKWKKNIEQLELELKDSTKINECKLLDIRKERDKLKKNCEKLREENLEFFQFGSRYEKKTKELENLLNILNKEKENIENKNVELNRRIQILLDSENVSAFTFEKTVKNEPENNIEIKSEPDDASTQLHQQNNATIKIEKSCEYFDF